MTSINKNAVSKTVINVLNNAIEIAGEAQVGQFICNETAQMSLLFEAQKNDSSLVTPATAAK
jgi:LPS O-antigen subunit length determinant protein (WzzB/FepE family)